MGELAVSQGRKCSAFARFADCCRCLALRVCLPAPGGALLIRFHAIRPFLLHHSLCRLSAFPVCDQSGSHDTVMCPSRIPVGGGGELNNGGVLAWKLDNVAAVSRR